MKNEMIRWISQKSFDIGFHAICCCTKKMLHIHFTIRSYFFDSSQVFICFNMLPSKIVIFFVILAFLLCYFSFSQILFCFLQPAVYFVIIHYRVWMVDLINGQYLFLIFPLGKKICPLKRVISEFCYVTCNISYDTNFFIGVYFRSKSHIEISKFS